ncbi:MAG: hypothetical protein ACFE0Q_00765 [Anaerolineae bacterium]
MILVDILIRIAIALLGIYLIYFTISTTIRVFVLPRGENAWLARQIFRIFYQIFLFFAYKKKTYAERDTVLALFAPVVLLVQPLIYLALIVLGFAPLYWVLDPRPLTLFTFEEAFFLSGSSLMTLGFATVAAHNIPLQILTFLQAAMGMIFVALVIAYLPTIYSAFSAREALVAMLEVRAGSPPSGVEMLKRVYRNAGGAAALDSAWERWEEWFAQIEESHTSLVALVFFRSPMPDRHWVTAAGAILDAAVLLDAVIDEPRRIESVMCIRAGYVSLRRIVDFFGTIPYDPDPEPTDPISIARDEFDDVYDELREAGIPVMADREQAWANFRGWRVNYDRVLIGLARITNAPYALWSSDRTTIDMKDVPGFTPFDTFSYRPIYETKNRNDR